jgi:hypothetical protein
MSAFGPKRTWAVALHMSAFGGKADMGKLYNTFGNCRHFAPHRSLILRVRTAGPNSRRDAGVGRDIKITRELLTPHRRG